VEPMTAGESARMEYRLDERISRYNQRVGGFYRFMVRYGTSLAALVLIVTMSYFSAFRGGVGSTDVIEELLVSEIEYGYVTITELPLDDNYVDQIITDFVARYGYESSRLILDQLESEEIEYLEKNFDVGGIL